MKHSQFLALLFSCSILFFVIDAEARIGAKMRVDKETEGRLLSVLGAADQLHGAMVTGDKKDVRKKINHLKTSVDKALKASMKPPQDNVKPHLVRILKSAKARLLDAQNVPDMDKSRVFYLKESFQQIVQLTRMYDLKHKFLVFFCPKDKEKSVWLQSEKKADNPFDRRDLAKCGTVMK